MASNHAQVVSSSSNSTRPSSSEYSHESPNGEDQPGCFASPSPTPTHAIQQAQNAPSPMLSLASGPSDVAATPGVSFTTDISPTNQLSIDAVANRAEKLLPQGNVTLKDRIVCYQWTYFTMTMATGGMANVLHSAYYQAGWIVAVGIFFCLLNIVLFLMNCILISARFYIRPGSFINSFTDQVESLFIPAFFVSIAIILINICQYGVPTCGDWLLQVLDVMFWVYISLGAVASAGLYLILWTTLELPIHMMTPTWVFPAYPLLLSGPFAANLIAAAEVSGYHHSINRTAIAICAATTQGTGCLIAFMISAAFIYRLMTQKLPRDMQRPGVFISIGPFGFTAASIALLGSHAREIVPSQFLDTPITADVIRVVSLLVALWLWGLSLWFFLVSVGSLWKYTRRQHKMPFQMTWWSFVFPNTGLVVATEVMGDNFKSKGLHIFGAIMTIILIVVWVGVFLKMLYCLRTRKLLWPEDQV